MLNELICVFLGHSWKKDFRYMFHEGTLHQGTRHEWTGPIGIEFMICLRCGREKVGGFVLGHYDD